MKGRRGGRKKKGRREGEREGESKGGPCTEHLSFIPHRIDALSRGEKHI